MKTVPTITSLTCGLIRHNEKRHRTLVYLERELKSNRCDPWYTSILKNQYETLLKKV